MTSVRGWWRWRYEAQDLVRSNAGWLLAGLFVSSAARAFEPSQKTIGACLGRYSDGLNFRSAITGAFVGLLLPCCSCGVLPLAVAAINNGASVAGALSMVSSNKPSRGRSSSLSLPPPQPRTAMPT